MSFDLVRREAGLRQVTCIVHERQLPGAQERLCGHVERLHMEDPAHRTLSCRIPRGWSIPKVCPHASWLHQVEVYLTDTGMTGLVCLDDSQNEVKSQF